MGRVSIGGGRAFQTEGTTCINWRWESQGAFREQNRAAMAHCRSDRRNRKGLERQTFARWKEFFNVERNTPCFAGRL